MNKLFLTGILFTTFLFGANAQTKLNLTIEDAKQHALTYNREIQKAGIGIEEAQAKLWETVSNGLPQVSGTVDYTNYLGFNMNFMGQGVPFNPTSTAQLSVGQLIFSGSYWVGIEMAKLSKKLSEKNVVKTELDVKENVTMAFNSILVAEEARRIVQKNMVNLEDVYKKTENMANVGIIEKNDVEQLSVQVMNMAAAIRNLDQQIELAYNMLRLQLGVSPDTEISLTGNLNDYAESINKGLMLADHFNVDNNINFQMLRGQEEILKKQISLNKAAYLPTITGFYSYTYKIKKPSFDMSPPNVIGLKATVPIFNSFNTQSKVKQSRLALKSLQTDIEQVNDQLNTQAKQLRFNLESAHDQYEIQKKNVAVSEKVYESNRKKHEQGMLSALALTTANNNYLQAQNNLLTSISDLLKAQTALMKLMQTL